MGEIKKKHRYRHEGGKRWIEVRVKSSQQLFDARDPSPFRVRDLDDDFVDYVLASAREFSISTPLKIVIYLQEIETKELPKDALRDAIRSYFLYKMDLQRGNLKRFMKQAQIFLAIGLIVLASCIWGAQRFDTVTTAGPLRVLREGLVIFGWVSMWKPIELIMFDWYPHLEKLRFYRKIFETEIDIRFSAEEEK